MDVKQILSADVLDIIFEGRNKAYGAYELRKTYNKRLMIALISSAVFITLFFCGYLLAKDFKPVLKPIITDVVVLQKAPEKKIEEPVIIQPKQKEIQQVKTVKVTTPVIVTDKDVPEREMPPEQTDIEDAKIGVANIPGESDKDIVAPPIVDGGKDIINAPKKQDGDDELFLRVEIESQYPGGINSWIRFIKKNLSNYPEQALEQGIQGTVVVQFIVDREGNISNVEAVSGPEELKPAAVTVIKKSGKWIPAEQNGKKVKSYKKQPITFQLSE